MPISRTLLAAVQAARHAHEDCVLATVVKVEGSAYRRPGARMLIPRIGPHQGTVSGGCLEREIACKAWWLTEQGAQVQCYSTAEEGEAGEEALGFGLGCNGRVHVLFERITGQGPSHLVETLADVDREGTPTVVATVIDPGRSALAVGERLTLSAAHPMPPLSDARLERPIREAAEAVYLARRSRGVVLDERFGAAEVFLEYLTAMPRLVVFGAGHDAQPLVRMARLLDWHVTVIDARSHFARRERFPEADEVLVRTLDTEADLMPRLQGALVAVMSHSLTQDAHWLALALRAEPCYVGQLGPRDRTERLLADIRGDTGPLPGLPVLHYPIGLDLGGDAPESVAMAILGEMQAHLHGRSGGSLKLRPMRIHQEEVRVRSVSLPEIEAREAI